MEQSEQKREERVKKHLSETVEKLFDLRQSLRITVISLNTLLMMIMMMIII